MPLSRYSRSSLSGICLKLKQKSTLLWIDSHKNTSWVLISCNYQNFFKLSQLLSGNLLFSTIFYQKVIGSLADLRLPNILYNVNPSIIVNFFLLLKFRLYPRVEGQVLIKYSYLLRILFALTQAINQASL